LFSSRYSAESTNTISVNDTNDPMVLPSPSSCSAVPTVTITIWLIFGDGGLSVPRPALLRDAKAGEIRAALGSDGQVAVVAALEGCDLPCNRITRVGGRSHCELQEIRREKPTSLHHDVVFLIACNVCPGRGAAPTSGPDFRTDHHRVQNAIAPNASSRRALHALATGIAKHRQRLEPLPSLAGRVQVKLLALNDKANGHG
jgi:hypothetical protein